MWEGQGGGLVVGRAPSWEALWAASGNLNLVLGATGTLQGAGKMWKAKEREKCYYDFLGFKIYCCVCSFQPAFAVLETQTAII